MGAKSRAGRGLAAVVLCSGSNGLGAVRSLAREGVETHAVALQPGEPVLASRYPRRKVRVQGSADEAALLGALLGGAVGGAFGRASRAALVPTSDRFVSFVVRHREALAERYDLCVPPGRLAAHFVDKDVETALVETVGLPLPKTARRLPENPDSLVRQLGLPILVKPRSFREAVAFGKNELLRTASDVRAFYEARAGDLEGLIAQEVIPGEDDALWVCNCTFDRRHELATAFTFRRLGMSPARYGVTTYAKSERNEEVLGLVARLGAAVGYVGPAMVEFKRDARDGSYKYVELNPRIGMCNFFDTRCGVNNVLAAVLVASGREVPARLRAPQAEGIFYLSPFEDLYARYKDGEGPISALRRYASNLRRRHVDVYFSLPDPVPWVVMAGRDGRSVLASLGRRALSASPARLTRA